MNSDQQSTRTLELAWEEVLDGLRFPEGPRWHDGALWFSDVHSGRIHRLDVDAGTAETIAESDTAPSGLGFLPDGRLLFASGSDLRLYSPAVTGELTVHADLSGVASWQLNDMIVDAHGHAYVGDYGDGSAPPDPITPVDLLRVDPNGTVSTAASDMSFANGMVLVADGRTLIVAETRATPGRLTAFDVAGDGSLSGRRVHCEFESGILPDGLARDHDDNVWVASPFSGELLRVTVSGAIDRRVLVPDPYAVAYRAPDEGARGEGELFVCTSPDWRPEATAGRPGGQILRAVLS